MSFFVAATVQVVRYPDSSAWIVVGFGAFLLILIFAVKKLADQNYTKDQ